VIKWSATKLKDATECMFKIYLKYEKKIKSKENYALASGKHVHSFCEKFNDHRLKRNNYQSAESFAKQGAYMWNNLVLPEKNLEEKFEGEKWATYNIMKKCLTNFYDFYGDREKPLDVERRFVLGIEDYLIEGYIDIIDKPFKHIDLKTGYHKPTEQELKNDYQFTIYAAALPFLAQRDQRLKEMFQLTKTQETTLDKNPLDLMEEVTGEFYHMRSGTFVQIKKTKNDLLELLNTIESVSHRAEQGDFTHHRGRHCDWCLYADKCNDYRNNNQIILPEPIREKKQEGMLFDLNNHLLKLHQKMPKIKSAKTPSKGKKKKKSKKLTKKDTPLFKDI
jgi:hypothetical protein